MRGHAFYIIAVIAIVGFLSFSALGKMDFVARTLIYSGSNDLATVYRAFFEPAKIQVNSLKDKYKQADQPSASKVKILLMPGHEPGFGGAEYRDLKEREMNVELVKKIQQIFVDDPRFEVIVPRDNNEWAPEFSKYFTDHWSDIVDFQTGQKEEMIRLLGNGGLSRVEDGVVHNKVPGEVALRLYGINKWVNDNNVDIAIHVHFNDYPRSNQNSPGDYNGFAIYVPENQYSNSKTSKTIADRIQARLGKYFTTSNLPKESGGVVEEQELIAIGSYNTVDAPSMLIEYGYIYEPQFKNSFVRDAALNDLALATYTGVKDFFVGNNEDSDDAQVSAGRSVSYKWQRSFSKELVAKEASLTDDVYHMQKALMGKGLYPPSGKDLTDCPISGQFGPCTEAALKNFQKQNGITGEVGKVGSKTLKALNDQFGVEVI